MLPPTAKASPARQTEPQAGEALIVKRQKGHNRGDRRLSGTRISSYDGALSQESMYFCIQADKDRLSA